MKLSGGSKSEGGGPQSSGGAQMTYATAQQQAQQQGGGAFPTIAPAPQQTVMSQNPQGIVSAHQGQFQVISSPPFGTAAAAAPNATQYVPQFATYNQQGQLVISPANFPSSAYGQQQIILTAATPGMQQAQQQQAQQQQQQQQQAQHQQQQAQHQQQQKGATQILTQGGNGKGGLVPMSQQQGYTLTPGGLVQSNGPQQPTFMFANASSLMAASQPGMLTSIPSSDLKQEQGKQTLQQQPPGAQTQQPQQQAHPQSLIMHNGMAYMNPQHQQAILQNGQIIIRAPSHEAGQQIMFSPTSNALQQQVQGQQQAQQQQQQQQQQQAGMPTGMAPPNLQPMSISNTIRQQTVSNAGTTTIPPAGKTAISRALPPLLPTSIASVRGGYPTTLPQSPISAQSVAQPPQSSPKTKQKMSPRGGGGHVGRPPGPSKVGVSGAALKQAGNRSTPPSTAPPQASSPRTMGPPILQTSQQQQPSPLNIHSQPPTLQPMMQVSTAAVIAGTQQHQPPQLAVAQYPPILAAATPPVTTVVVSSAKVLNTSMKTPVTASKSVPSVIKSKPSSTPPLTSTAGSGIMTTSTGSSSVGNTSSVNTMSTSTSSSLPVSQASSAMTDSASPAENGLPTPKAIVKPNVLTHVIDGHIIQESSQPFPLESAMNDDKGRGRKKSEKDNSVSNKKTSESIANSNGGSSAVTTTSTAVTSMTSTSSALSTSTTTTAATTTPINSNLEKKRGPGRPPGSTRQNLDNQRIQSQDFISSKGNINSKSIDSTNGAPNEKRRKLDDNLIKPANNIPPPSSTPTFKNNPLKWSVQQVCDFVKSLHGCAEYVEDFMLQEIDGQALMLLKTEHLMAAMSIKLGPALKICSAINAMREELKQN